jgi:hypothetical protein
VAAPLTKVAGTRLQCVLLSREAVIQAMKRMGAGEWLVNLMGQYPKGYGENCGDFTIGEVKAITGHGTVLLKPLCASCSSPPSGHARGARRKPRWAPTRQGWYGLRAQPCVVVATLTRICRGSHGHQCARRLCSFHEALGTGSTL